MEIMFCNENNELIKNKHATGLCGDKKDLINFGLEFEGIIYDDEWTVKRFLNGYKLKVDEDILALFHELEVNELLLKKKIKDLSKAQFKFILLIYSILKKYKILVLDFFDKGLSYKSKKRIINYLKSRYNGTLLVISNDIIFLNNLCDKLLIIKDGTILFNDKTNYLFKTNIKYAEPNIIKFIKLANKKNASLSYTIDNKELLKDIYRSLK